MKTKFNIAFTLAVIASLLITAVGLASSVDVAVVDVTIPVSSVTLSPGGSASITINMTVTGNQVGTATFEVNTDWVLSGGSFTGSSPQTFTVSPRAATDPPTLFSTTGTVNVQSSQAAGTFTLAATAFDITNTNTTGAKLSDGADSNYQVTVAGKLNQTITVAAPAPSTAAYGTSFTVAATGGGSGNPVVYSSSGACTNVGATFTMSSGTGTCTVHYNQAGNASYNAALEVTSGTTAQKADATIKVSGYSVDYDGDSHTADASATGISDEDLSGLFDLSGTTHTDVGDYPTDAWSFAGNANYNTTNGTVHDKIGQAASTVTVTCPASVVYNGSAQTPCTATVTGGGGLSLTPTPTYLANTNAGMATASYTYAGDINHTGSTDSKTFEIKKAPVMATAGSGSDIYNGSAQTPSDCVVTGAYTGDLTCANDPASVGPDAGTTTIVPAVSGTGLSNYEITPVNGSYKIEKADPTCDITGYTGNYDGNEHGAFGTCTGVGGKLDVLDGLDLGLKFTDVPGGTAHWVFTDVTGNYNNAEGDAALVINKAPVTAMAGSGTTTYDGSIHVPSACLVSGVYKGDLTCTNNPTSVGPGANTYSISPDVNGTGLSNFDITPVNGSYTIEKADPVCTISGYSVVFDFNAHTATGFCKGVLGETLDDLDLTGTTHTAVGSWVDSWSFTDVTGNYNNASGTVNDVISAWTLKGFYAPVDMNGVYNVVKGGSTVPLKFEVFAGGTELTSTSVVKSFVQTKIACDGSLPTDEIEVVSTGGTSLRYDSTGGQFIQNWQTPKLPGQCYRVTMTTQDGSTLVAYFKLK